MKKNLCAITIKIIVIIGLHTKSINFACVWCKSINCKYVKVFGPRVTPALRTCHRKSDLIRSDYTLDLPKRFDLNYNDACTILGL